MPRIKQLLNIYFTVIDRYILREFMLNLLAVTSVLWLIYVVTRFSRYLGQAAVGVLPSDVIFTLLGYSSVGAMNILLPIGSFLALLLALGRMNADSELVVMASCGLGFQCLLRNVLLFATSIGLIVGALSLFIVPAMLSERSSLEERAEIKANTSGLVSGGFKESRDGEWVFYAQNLQDDDQETMENIFIKINRKDARPLILRAESGRFDVDSSTNDQFLILYDGYRYEGDAGDKDFVIVKFESHSMLIEKGNPAKKSQRHKALSTMTLFERGQARDWAELQWRFSTVIMTIVLCCIAITLAHTAPRKGRYAGLLPAVLIYIVYSNLLGISRAWVAKELMPVWLGAIWVHGLMVILFLVMHNWPKINYFIKHRHHRVQGASL